MDIRVGDRVMIRKDSYFYGVGGFHRNPKDTVGVVDEIESVNSCPYRVIWSVGKGSQTMTFKNVYNKHDLVVFRSLQPRKYIKEFTL